MMTAMGHSTKITAIISGGKGNYMKQRKLKKIRQERAGHTHFYMSAKNFVLQCPGAIGMVSKSVSKLGWRELNRL